jgi:hypothetical protein
MAYRVLIKNLRFTVTKNELLAQFMILGIDGIVVGDNNPLIVRTFGFYCVRLLFLFGVLKMCILVVMYPWNLST